MQDKKMTAEIVMLGVPAEMLLEAGIYEGDPMQIYVEDNKLVIKNIDDIGEIVCGGECDSCPIDMTDCDSDCESCPCREYCEYCEVSKK